MIYYLIFYSTYWPTNTFSWEEIEPDPTWPTNTEIWKPKYSYSILPTNSNSFNFKNIFYIILIFLLIILIGLYFVIQYIKKIKFEQTLSEIINPAVLV